MEPFSLAELQRHRLLVARMAAGETRALRELHGIYLGPILGLTARILADREEAREAAQDAFIKAWRRAGAYQPERGEVVSWLVLIARNTAIDRLREGIRRKAIHSDLAREAATAETTAREPVNAEREELDHHLLALTPDQREALELSFYSGCSQAEIAHRMQVPVSAVKNYLHRGLSKLRQLHKRHD